MIRFSWFSCRFLSRCGLIGATLLLPLVGFAHFGNYRDHRVEPGELSVFTNKGELSIRTVNAHTFEIHYEETGVKQLPSYALVPGTTGPQATLAETDTDLRYALPGITVHVRKAPVTLAFSRDREVFLEEETGYFHHETIRGFRFRLGTEEKILGGGQRVLGMDRRGHRMPLYNRAHYGYETESDQMYYSLPAVLSNRRYILVFDNSATGYLDIGKYEKDILQFDAMGGRTAYTVTSGPHYPALIEAFTDATGRQPMPPRWALGNFASRFGYRTEEETRSVVKGFREAGIPLDAVVLDLYWFGPEIKGHMGNLDWDRDAFPDPVGMINDFARKGIRTIAITEPFVLTTSKNWKNAVNARALALNPAGQPKTFEFYFGTTGLIDVFNREARDWFWQAYQKLFQEGTAGTWGDLGEPEVHPSDSIHFLSGHGLEATADEIHNAYGHTWAQMVYEKQVGDYPDTRPVILMRSGFVGTQRYGIIPWTGDVNRTWGGLQPQVELSLQMSLFGLAYTHSDLGGFAGGETFDQELYLRWLQYGVFQPVYRPHAQEHIPPEPIFHDPETIRIARDAIKLRYRMMPYIYTLAYENSLTGMPLMRPVFFGDESDPDLIDIKNAYFWGDAFFVQPVVEPNVDEVSVSLPPGVWFDFSSGQRYEGGRDCAIPLTLEKIPVFVRAGAFVPMVGDFLTTKDYSSENLTLHYYADSSVEKSEGQMYEDDGETRESLSRGEFELLRFSAIRDRRSLSIELTREGNGYPQMPSNRTMNVVIHNWKQKPSSVTFAHEIPLVDSLPSSRDAAFFDSENQQIILRLTWDHSSQTLNIR